MKTNLGCSFRICLPVVILLGIQATNGKGDTLDLQLQQRHRETGELQIETATVDARRIGVVVVDIWNWHWCKTAAARVDCFVPRMNACLKVLREQGATVFVCPTDVVDRYVGLPQRERALAVELMTLPAPLPFSCPAPPNGPGCACLQKCRVNFGWNGMNPRLELDPADLMPNSREALYTLATRRGITHLLYMGVHTQVCLLGKDIGLRNMKALGFQCILARDLTDSHPDYAPDRGITPDELTARTVAHFEQYLCATVDLKEQLDRLGLWTADPTDPVRAAPWGTLRHPHLFDKQTLVTLSTPLQPDSEIRFTTNGDHPTADSRQYRAAIRLTGHAVLRAQAYSDGQPVSPESTFVFFKRPAQPPLPQIHVSGLNPVSVLGPGHSPSDSSHRFSPGSLPPQPNRSNRGLPLRLNGQDYEYGIGTHAPNRIEYELDPDWEKFVAEVGVDENIIKQNLASDLGCLPSVMFRVFLDGNLAAESPVMRFLDPSWRFNVTIPRGTKRIVLAALPTGDGNREDLANWVNAGFVTTGAVVAESHDRSN